MKGKFELRGVAIKKLTPKQYRKKIVKQLNRLDKLIAKQYDLAKYCENIYANTFTQLNRWSVQEQER